jgi:hypothetical protein
MDNGNDKVRKRGGEVPTVMKGLYTEHRKRRTEWKYASKRELGRQGNICIA